MANILSLPLKYEGIVCHYCCSAIDGAICNSDDIPEEARKHPNWCNLVNKVVLYIMVSYIERKNRILRTPYGLTPLNTAYQRSGGGGHSDFS